MTSGQPWSFDALLPELSTLRAAPAAWPGAGIRLHAAAIEERGFDRSWFAAAGIACPERIYDAVRKRQAEFFGGRLCAAAALAEHGCVAAPIGIGPLSAPLWPAGFTGSITHTRKVAAAVAFPSKGRGGVGIDLEEIDEVAATDGLEGLVMTVGERERLRLVEGMDAPTRLALVFSAKESFFKAAAPSVGRYFGFEAIEFVSANPAAGRLNFVVRETLSPRFQPGTVWSITYALGGG
ncbi:MAG TPA: 4'-phosphopantetheinyl transferase superfamily protein, partial [Telluria sp.]|nr:4'-phosphopantetheinyl transferase superfamily protein [Telluria sp.]